MKNTTEDVEYARTKHRNQLIIHGPVIYTDRVYDALTRDCDESTRFVASIFTKSTKYAAQREYRFAVLNQGTDKETVILQISGMMRDALKRTEKGLIRNAPSLAETAGDDQNKPSPRRNETKTPVSEWTKLTERVTEREERRRETRNPDGQVASSDSELSEKDLDAIVHGINGITIDTALRLGHYFGMAPEFWINLQTRYDLDVAEHTVRRQIEREIEPLIISP